MDPPHLTNVHSLLSFTAIEHPLTILLHGYGTEFDSIIYLPGKQNKISLTNKTITKVDWLSGTLVYHKIDFMGIGLLYQRKCVFPIIFMK